jgi:hypothetical protein
MPLKEHFWASKHLNERLCGNRIVKFKMNDFNLKKGVLRQRKARIKHITCFKSMRCVGLTLLL